MRSKILALFGLMLSWGAFPAPAPSAQQAANAAVSPTLSAGQNGNGIATGSERNDQPVLQHRNPRYRVHSADVLELNFPFSPEFNQTVTVQPDGYVSLRGIEAIHVEGQTLPDLVKLLETSYAKILHDPEINIELKDFERPYFIVGGEVGRPGKFDLRSETTVAEAVAIAGGFRESSKHSEILLFHRVPDGWSQARKVNLKKLLHQANLQEDSYLQPGDFVYVPKNTFSKIARFIPTSSFGMYSNPAFLR
jgi:polysaccharide export outer membrane protein